MKRREKKKRKGKNWRGRLCLLLAIILAAVSVPVPFGGGMADVYAVETPEGPLSGTCGDSITWELTVDTQADWDLAQGTPYKLTLTGTGRMYGYNGTVYGSKAPWSGYSAFITTLSIGEGVTSIGNLAFHKCASLKSVTIPDSVTSIGDWAFSENSLLTTVEFGENLEEIGYQAFYKNTSLTTVNFNQKFKRIGIEAFNNCYALKSVDLPDSLTSIGGNSFRGTGLTEITIPKGVTSIGYAVFESCYRLKSILVEEGNDSFEVLDSVLYEMKEGRPYRAVALPCGSGKTEVHIPEGTEIIESSAFSYAGSVTVLTLPDTLKEIKDSAFYGLSITELELPDSVEMLDQNAFARNSFLKSLKIGKGMKDIYYTAFWNCSRLESIAVSEENTYFDAVDYVLYNKAHTKLLVYPAGKTNKKYHVPDGTEKINPYAISYTSCLEELYLPDTITQVDGIGYNNVLKSIYFYGNAPQTANIERNPAELILYKTPDSTGWDAKLWEKFVVVDWNMDNDTVEEGSFGEISWKYQGDIGRITFTGCGAVPDFTGDNVPPWSAYMEEIQTIEGNELTGIGANAFFGAEKLIRIETEESLQTIGDSAFSDCPKLLFADISTVEQIGERAFFNDSSLKSPLTLEKVSAIGSAAFSGCTSLADVMLGARLQSLSADVFSGCSALAELIIPDSVTGIGAGACSDCTALRTVNIPAFVESIGAGAFSGDTALCKVYFYGLKPQEWAEDSFLGCSDDLTLYYRSEAEVWEELGGVWNGLPVCGLDRFYTEQADHYSFDNSAISFGYPDGYRIPRQRYVDVLDSVITGTYYYSINKYWGGSCYGMAGTTLEFYEDTEEFSPSAYTAGAANLYEVSAPHDKNSALTKLIEAYQISQYQPDVSGCMGSIVKNMGQYRRLIGRVEEFERSGGLRVDSCAEPVIMAVYGIFGGHVVIPVSVEQAENGDFKLLVYDPNFPSGLQTLTIYKDYSGISYGWYVYASYVEYSVMAAAMDDVTLNDGAGVDSSLYLSIDKEFGTVSSENGGGLADIEGAYEQKAFTGTAEDTFSGIRSYVLPEGNYYISGGEEKEDDSVTFYLASEDAFAEIISSDEDAVLGVKQTGTEDGSLELTLTTEDSEENEEQTTGFTLVNRQGMEHSIEVEGSDASVSVSKDDTFTVRLAGEGTVSIDGKSVQTEDGTVEGSFIADSVGTAIKTEMLETEASCDEKNRLSGAFCASVISNQTDVKNAAVTAEFFDAEDRSVASYSEEKELAPGWNTVDISFNELETAFRQTEGEAKLRCVLTVEDADGNRAAAESDSFTVVLTKQEQSGSTQLPDHGDQGGNIPTKPDEEQPKPDTGLQPGENSQINASNQNQSVKVKKLSISVVSKRIAAGKKVSLKVGISPTNASDKDVSFYIGNRKRASVNSRGVVTMKKSGAGKKVYVIVVANDGSNAKAVVQFEIMKNAVTKVKLKNTVKTLETGKSAKLKAVVSTNGKHANTKLKWISSNPKYASVNSKGKVTAKKEGKGKTVMITALSTDGTNKKARVKIKIK